MLLEAKLLCHCDPNVQLSVSTMTLLSHEQEGKYFSNSLLEPLGKILLISFVQNVQLCAFTNCCPGPRNFYSFNEGDQSINRPMFLRCLFEDSKTEKLRNSINPLIISLCKKCFCYCNVLLIVALQIINAKTPAVENRLCDGSLYMGMTLMFIILMLKQENTEII